MKQVFVFLIILSLIMMNDNVMPESKKETIQGESACKVRAFLIDPDKSGTNVRTAPKGKVIKKLPLQTDPNYEAGVYLNLIASKDNWLQIDSVEDTNDPAYKDSWVFGRMVGTGTNNYDGKPVNLYEKPSSKSKVKGKLLQDQIVAILGCAGKWVYVAGKGAGDKEVTGWLEPEKQCSSAVTNCN